MATGWEWMATVQDQEMMDAMKEGWEPYAAIYDPDARRPVEWDKNRPSTWGKGSVVHYLKRPYEIGAKEGER